MDFEKLVGQSVGYRRLEYTWRDTALYALAVGGNENDTMYFYEKGMKTLPSFGVVPYWNALNTYPQIPQPYPASVMVADQMTRELGHPVVGLHMEHELIMHRPIDPIKGTLVFNDTITDVYDRGAGKGIAVKTCQPIYDESGILVCENRSSTFYFDGGGFGGKPMPRPEVEIPRDREPDILTKDYISKVQNFLYRLTGDTNRGHVDKSEMPGGGKGFDRPFMQGLCSFGFACRMLIDAVIPGEPERMTRMAVQMRNVCYPGTNIELAAWKEAEGRVIFRLMNKDDGKPVLDRGVFEYR